MPLLKDELEKTEAIDIMDRLVAGNIEAQLQYRPGASSESWSRHYSVWVARADMKRAREVLHATAIGGVEPDLELEEGEAATKEEDWTLPSEAMFACPRCGSREYKHLDADWAGLLLGILVCLLTLGLFLPVWFWLLQLSKSSPMLRCESCRHTWRAKIGDARTKT
jgi:DNA-directed RNA polymerase subunit M/transcription elongation factor TFIIS